MAGESSKTFDFDYRYFNDDEVNDFINDHDYGWKTVTYKKKDKKQQNQGSSVVDANGDDSGDRIDVFRSIELQAEERRKRLIQAGKGVVVDSENSGELIENNADANEEKENEVAAVNGAGKEKKKTKAKKPKKAKVTVSEAASKIDPADLDVFLAEITVSYETQEDIQLMRFADYFGRSFAMVSGSQSALIKILKESSVAKMVNIPISHISDDVLKTSTTWLGLKSSEALGSFVMWSLDNIVSELDLHQKTSSKGSKMVNTRTPAKSQIGIFVVLAMVLRHKPDVLMSLLPLLKENPKYHEQNKLYVAVWVITQACEGDIAVGMFMWANFLLPMLCNGSNDNTQCRDLILQVVERIVSMPKARAILVNIAVKKAERLVPPSALDALMRFTFPADAARLKETERFEAIYPTLREIALAASVGSKVMNQLAHQILPFALKATGEGNPELAEEGADLFIWCLIMNPDCYHQWDNLYLENIEASVVILKKLPEDSKLLTGKYFEFEPLKTALMNFVLKNDKGLANEVNADRKAALKDAQRHCKKLLSRLSRGNGCLKVSVLVVTMVIAVSSAAYLAFNQKSI